jgi:hypothetical protein
MPRPCSSSAIWVLSSGETVLQSAITNPFFAPFTRPFSPRMTPRDMAVSPTHRKAQSLFCATSMGVAQNNAPAESARSFAFFWLFDHTATLWPPVTK